MHAHWKSCPKWPKTDGRSGRVFRARRGRHICPPGAWPLSRDPSFRPVGRPGPCAGRTRGTHRISRCAPVAPVPSPRIRRTCSSAPAAPCRRHAHRCGQAAHRVARSRVSQIDSGPESWTVLPADPAWSDIVRRIASGSVGQAPFECPRAVRTENAQGASILGQLAKRVPASEPAWEDGAIQAVQTAGNTVPVPNDPGLGHLASRPRSG